MLRGTDVRTSNNTATVIDPRAQVDPEAQIGPGVQVGPWSYVGPRVVLGEGTRVGPHVVIHQDTEMGAHCVVHAFASVGCDPQDKKYQGETTRLVVGDHNVLRECVTISRGTGLGGGITTIGSHNLLMAYVHVAHDCHIGDHTIFSNNATLAGHVSVDDQAILSAFSMVHQFCRIGMHSFLGMGAFVNQDVVPYMLVAGSKAKVRGINQEGLRRRGYSEDTLRRLKDVYKLIFRQGMLLSQVIDTLEQQDSHFPEVQHVLDFLRTSERGIVR